MTPPLTKSSDEMKLLIEESTKEDIIDVDSWSQKELLKHLYRMTVSLKKDIENINDKLDGQKEDYSTKISNLNDKFETRVRSLEDYKTTQLGMWKFITAISTIVSFVSACIAIYSLKVH